jgi:hypothetical protein
MRKLILILINFCFFSCSSDYKNSYEYYYSKDKKKVFTEMNYQGDTYFIYGHYDGVKPPKDCIQPIEGYDNEYWILQYWDKDTCHLISTGTKCAVIGYPLKLYFREVDNLEYYKIVDKEKNSKALTGYIHKY